MDAVPTRRAHLWLVTASPVGAWGLVGGRVKKGLHGRGLREAWLSVCVLLELCGERGLEDGGGGIWDLKEAKMAAWGRMGERVLGRRTKAKAPQPPEEPGARAGGGPSVPSPSWRT